MLNGKKEQGKAMREKKKSDFKMSYLLWALTHFYKIKRDKYMWN